MNAALFAIATWCWAFAVWHFVVRAKDSAPPLHVQERQAAEHLYGRRA